MTTTARAWSIPGFGTVTLDSHDRHPTLLWIATGGLVLAAILGGFGMPPFDLHLPTHQLGIMGPTCGMTRSVARAAVGDVTTAWRYNPGGLVLVAGAWAAVGRAVAGRLTGRWFNVRLVVTRRGWCVILLVLAGLTVNQQLHAELLA